MHLGFGVAYKQNCRGQIERIDEVDAGRVPCLGPEDQRWFLHRPYTMMSSV